MALSSTGVLEVRVPGSGASDSNGGYFKTGASGTDWSVYDTPQYSPSGTLTSAGAGNVILYAAASSDMVGNGIQITGGTNFVAGLYEITAVSAGVSITVTGAAANACTGVGASGSGNIGGAFATPEGAAAFAIAGNTIYIKSGTYSRTAAGATMTCDGSNTAFIRFVGYDTNRNIHCTDSSRPLFTTPTGTSANGITLFAGNGVTYVMFRNINFSHQATVRGNVWSNATAQTTPINYSHCKFDGFVSYIASTGATANAHNNMTFWFCEFANFSASCHPQGLALSTVAYCCYIHDGVSWVDNNQSSGGILAQNCTFDTLSSYAILITRATTSQPSINAYNNIFYNCTSGGIRLAGNAGIMPNSSNGFALFNNIFYSSAYGVSCSNTQVINWSICAKNAFGNGTSMLLNTSDTGEDLITLTADPFVDAPNGDFRLNNATGGGASLRQVGWPTSYPGGLTTQKADVGPVQNPPTVAY